MDPPWPSSTGRESASWAATRPKTPTSSALTAAASAAGSLLNGEREAMRHFHGEAIRGNTSDADTAVAAVAAAAASVVVAVAAAVDGYFHGNG